MYYFFGALLLIIAFLLIFFYLRKMRIINRINGMSIYEKVVLINELVAPLGYRYESEEDIFTSTLNAWQRNFGYAEIYDKLAPFFNMVYDCQPVYFNYNEKTWLI